MKDLLVIGIGAGDAGDVTLRAVEAMRRVDVFFLLEKPGRGKSALVDLRLEVLRRACPGGGYRLVYATDPERPKEVPDYPAAMAAWREERRRLLAELFGRELAEGETGGFLVIGDPGLYDGTIEIFHELEAQGAAVSFEVVPGITSLQLLAARHRIALNRIGETITIISARQLAAADAASLDNVLVVLDGRALFRRFADTDLDIYWGAYLGMPEEILVSGPLRGKAEEIARIIGEERARRGWIMDVYLLRRPSSP
ncbi:precorrin-6A synthase (deacetylating) [Afifella pfennigii]|uniref:precorrin-6A synthase (deacetylating) n=1 Tax=Afifella pfennigii TaxID=209897 RepID=UPI000478C1CD|nr:precorrin-6A synthase (deacetylating) [Afifella pfennigii]